jgi:hypothetical protein
MQQSNSERGCIERREAVPGQSCGGDATRGDMLAEAEVVSGRVGSKVSSRQPSGVR